jgi:uncharacterized protein YndB with AHSA1/START domain
MMSRNAKPLVLERELQAPANLVWEALTDIRLLQKWQPYFTSFKPEVGFVTRFELGREGGRQYTHICEVTEVVEGKRLTYSWRYEGYEGDSYVTFELDARGSQQTKVTLTHTITEGFPASNPDFALRNFAEGWTNILTVLTHYTEQSQ